MTQLKVRSATWVTPQTEKELVLEKITVSLRVGMTGFGFSWLEVGN